jgi:U32 family peptidase
MDTKDSRLSLPLLNAAPAPSPRWQGLSVSGPVPPLHLTDAEPLTPQGAYNPAAPEMPLSIPLLPGEGTVKQVELLSPAGGLDAAFAAFHYGADAIYLGLKKFSARAEAENFTLDELDEVIGFAHALQPRRRVFVTINTLIRQDELAELIEALAALEDMGADAVILQDLGVYRAIRQYFPKLELHGSTQMAVHNRAGAEVLKQMGCRRVVLARELTFEEVHEITQTAGVETEVFIHGALCYAYSGLCLFSAQTLGRSGNRGKCAYSCRDSYEVTGAPDTLRDGTEVKRDPATGFPFSMKDLALPDHLPALRAAGVSCFKIEGRKKSPLYVATTTDYYRKLIDGRLDPEERPDIEAELQTVFSRPWTRLFVQSHKDKEVADRDTVGHRGTVIGKVDRVSSGKMRFVTRRPLERHDGLQIDLPILGKPYGFAVDRLFLLAGARDQNPKEVYAAPAGSLVEVAMPADHPAMPAGAPVYCSSSQAVKQKYRHDRPKPGLHRVRLPLRLDAVLQKDRFTLSAQIDGMTAVAHLAGPFPICQDKAAMAEAVRTACSRLGASPFELADLSFRNDANGFIPVSKLNALRRDVLNDFTKRLAETKEAHVASLLNEITPKPRAEDPKPAGSPFHWSIKVDRLAFLEEFTSADWQDIDEVIVDITRDHPAQLRENLNALAGKIGPDHIRLALPALTRKWEEKAVVQKIETLREAGWKKWEAANLSAWNYLGIDPTCSETVDIDLATDWSVYVLNRLAALQLLDMGVSRFALSPEDGLPNMRTLLKEFGPRAVVIVYQDTPLFLAESCAYANLIGGCPGKANCNFQSMEMVSSHGEKVTALDYHCRTIVLNQGPFCLSPRLRELARNGAVSLRADFIYRPYEAGEVRDRWRMVRNGQKISGGHSANWERGIL